MSREVASFEAVTTALRDQLDHPDTDQLIAITAQGTSIQIAVAIAPATGALWARVLREVADELEAGLPALASTITKLAN